MNTGERLWTPAESEFFAEQEIVEIVPNFRGAKMNFISGSFGPFKPAKPVNVPLWLAVYLKQRKRCDIQMPTWLDVDFLKKVRAEDKANGLQFSPALPYYYNEIAQLLLHECMEEIPNHKQLKSVLEDIQEQRKDKLSKVLKQIEGETPVKFLSNCGSNEVQTHRAVYQASYGVVNRIQ